MPAVQSKAIRFTESDFDNMFFVTIDGYPNYKVNPDGLIKNVKTNRILKPRLNKNGYLYAMLSKNGIAKNKRVHILVANAFLTKSDEDVVVDHINNVRTDNRIENLRFTSSNENNRNRLKHSNVNYTFVNEVPSNSLHITQIKDNDVSDVGLYYNKNTNEFYLKMTNNKYRIMHKNHNNKSYRITFRFNSIKITYSSKQLRKDYPAYFD